MVSLHTVLLHLTWIFICKANMTTFDCPMRELALQFAQYIQPHLSMQQLQQIADALNGSPEAQNCNVQPTQVFKHNLNDIPKHKSPPSWPDIHHKNDKTLKIYVSTKHGSNDFNSGLSINSPLKTIEFALNKLRSYRHHSPSQPAMLILREGVYYLNNTLNFNYLDSNLIITNFNNEQTTISGAIPLYNCSWQLYKKTADNYNIYSVNLKDSLTLKLNNNALFDGLRVNRTRGIRARYPNANPELDGFGSSLLALEWFPSIITPLPDDEIYITDYPIRNESATNEFTYYQAGIGGICEAFNPPMGYWCGTKSQGGGPAVYQVPHGFVYNQSILPNTPYKNTTNGIVSVWRPAQLFTLTIFSFDNPVFIYNEYINKIKVGRHGFSRLEIILQRK